MKVAAIYLSERSFPRYYDPQTLELSHGDICVVEDSQITEATGRVELLETRCEYQVSHGKYPRVLRMATEKEAEQWRRLKQREMEAVELAKEASRRLNLEMKIATVRFDDRQRRVIFNFTADQRVDFRQLVRELASALKSRIELWQIGVRDESRVVNGFGICGQNLCCSSWIQEFRPVSIRQAKDQDLMLSPTKLSGQCGRLLCCLTYEHDQYKAAARGMPNVGAICRTTEGEEVIVLDRNLLMQKAVVRDPQGHTRIIEIAEIDEIVGKAPPSALRQDPAARAAALANGDQGASRRTERRGARFERRGEESGRELEDQPAPKKSPTSEDSKPQSEERSQKSRRGRRGRGRSQKDKAGPGAASPQAQGGQKTTSAEGAKDSRPQGKRDSRSNRRRFRSRKSGGGNKPSGGESGA